MRIRRSIQNALVRFHPVYSERMKDFVSTKAHQSQFSDRLKELKALAVKTKNLFRASRGTAEKLVMTSGRSSNRFDCLLQQGFVLLPSAQTPTI